MESLELTPPPAILLALEPLRAIADYVAGLAPLSHPLPQGDGHPVIVFPGLGVSGYATEGLRGRLGELNYEVHDWEQGVNQWPDTDFDSFLDLLSEQLKQIYSQNGLEPWRSVRPRDCEEASEARKAGYHPRDSVCGPAKLDPCRLAFHAPERRSVTDG
jgi:hypothetical protein